jgi:hypothetical protein
VILVRTDGAVDGITSLRIPARNCDEAPTGSIFDQQEGCVPAAGACFHAYDESGAYLGNCEAAVDTSESGPSFPVFAECSVEVPYGRTGIVTEDLASIPNFTPDVNPMSFFTTGSTVAPPDSYFGTVFVNLRQAGADDDSIVTDLPDNGAGPDSNGAGGVLLMALSTLTALLGVTALHLRQRA